MRDEYANEQLKDLNASKFHPVNEAADCNINNYMPDESKIKELRNIMIKDYLYKNVMANKRPLKSFMCDIEKQVIEYSLFLTQGNQKVAAQLIGVNPTTLFEKMKKYGIVYIPQSNKKDCTKDYREMILLSIENKHYLKQYSI